MKHNVALHQAELSLHLLRPSVGALSIPHFFLLLTISLPSQDNPPAASLPGSLLPLAPPTVCSLHLPSALFFSSPVALE